MAAADAYGIDVLAPVIVSEFEVNDPSAEAEIIGNPGTWLIADKLKYKAVPCVIGPTDPKTVRRLINEHYGDGNPVARIEQILLFIKNGGTVAAAAKRFEIERTYAHHVARLEHLIPEGWEALKHDEITLHHARLIAARPAAIERSGSRMLEARGEKAYSKAPPRPPAEQREILAMVAQHKVDTGKRVSVRKLKSALVDIEMEGETVVDAPTKPHRGSTSLESQISDALGQEVQIRGGGDSGVVMIAYTSGEEFEGLMERMRIELSI
ncbi:MAG: hypothetical protein AMS22_15655 [Thiotrichales bacterium SG8_50]|nr:MAG: hypothetical protein AMS22_15655 [Thiotrichales bacterium SG8_50]